MNCLNFGIKTTTDYKYVSKFKNVTKIDVIEI